MTFVFDTQALLILYLGESGAERVAENLTQVLEKKEKAYINVVNLAELYLQCVWRKEKHTRNGPHQSWGNKRAESEEEYQSPGFSTILTITGPWQ